MNKISAKISKLTHRGNIHIKVDIPNTLQSRKLVKAINGRKFSRTHRCWYVPNTQAALKELKQYFEVEFFENRVIANKEIIPPKPTPPVIEKPSNSIPTLLVRIEPEHDFRVKVFVPWQKKDWIEQIKSLPNRAWNSEQQYWSVPKNSDTFHQLQSLFGEQLKVNSSIQWKASVNPFDPVAARLAYNNTFNQTPQSEVIANRPTQSKSKNTQNKNTLFSEGQKIFKQIQKGKQIFKVFVGEKILLEKNHEEWLTIYVPFDKKGWIEVVKNIPGRKWDLEEKYWKIPYVKDSLLLLTKNIGKKYLQFTFDVNPEIPKSFQVPYKKQNTKPYNSDLNEMQQRAITALEEKLILEGKRFRTIQTYKNQLRSFLRFHKDKKPSTISFKEITRYIIVRKKQDNISDSYLNQLINALNAFYIRVLDQEEKLAKLERPPKRKNLPNVFSEEEIAMVLKASTNLKHKCMLILCYSGGLRKQEVLNLRVNDLNFDRKTLFIKDGKGGKDRYTFFSEVAMKYIKIYLEQYSPTIWLFEGQTGGQYSASSIQSVFEKAKQKAGVNYLVTLHGLRHSFATHLVEKGVPLHVVQELLGHGSIKTTEIYLHISNKYRKELKSPLDSMDI